MYPPAYLYIYIHSKLTGNKASGDEIKFLIQIINFSPSSFEEGAVLRDTKKQTSIVISIDNCLRRCSKKCSVCFCPLYGNAFASNVNTLLFGRLDETENMHKFCTEERGGNKSIVVL